jgi:hypothetical protein
MSDDPGSDIGMLILVTVDLIGQGVEQTIAYSARKQVSKGVLTCHTQPDSGVAADDS